MGGGDGAAPLTVAFQVGLRAGMGSTKKFVTVPSDWRGALKDARKQGYISAEKALALSRYLNRYALYRRRCLGYLYRQGRLYRDKAGRHRSRLAAYYKETSAP